jgi:hypothetical protein
MRLSLHIAAWAMAFVNGPTVFHLVVRGLAVGNLTPLLFMLAHFIEICTQESVSVAVRGVYSVAFSSQSRLVMIEANIVSWHSSRVWHGFFNPV